MAQKREKSYTGVVLVALGLALAVWVCWPLVKFLPSAIPYTFSAKPDERVAGLAPGDHLQLLYHLNLLREAVDGKIPLFANPYEFAGPYRLDAPYIYFPFALVYTAFSYVSPAFGYNMLVLLSFVGTMIAGYGLARAWGANRGGAVCAGIALTLFPRRLNSLFGGHSAGFAFFLFPMAWWGLEKNWQTGRRRWGFMAAVSLVVMGIEDAHHLFFFCLLLPFWALWKLLDEKGVKFPERTSEERFRFPSASGSLSKRTLGDASVKKRGKTPSSPNTILPQSSFRKRSKTAVSWQGMTAAGLFAACYHFHQVRMRAVSVVSPTFVGLLVFFSVAVLGVVSLTYVVLRWLGVKQGTFRRRWLSWPWASFWVLPGYFAAGYVNRPGFGSKLILGALFLFGLFHLAFLARGIQKRAFSAGKIRVPWRRVLKLWPSAAGLVVAVIYPLFLKIAVFAKSGVAGGRSLFEVSLFSIPFWKLFVRSPEEGAYVGWAFVGLMLTGALALLLSRKYEPLPEERRRLRICFLLTVLGMVLACGVLLGSVFPLYNVLLRSIPFLNYIRATGKYLLLTATGGAVAVALLLTVFERRIGHCGLQIADCGSPNGEFRRHNRMARMKSSISCYPVKKIRNPKSEIRNRATRRWLSHAVAVVLILDWGLVSKVGVSVLPRHSPLYERVAKEGKGTRLLELPIWPGDSAFSSPYEYGTMLTGIPIINGYSPMVPVDYKEKIADPLYSLNFGIFTQKEFDLLKSLNVRFINFHQNLFPRQVSSLPATHSLKKLLLNPNLELVAEEDGAHLFRMAGVAYDDVSGTPCDKESSVFYYVPYDLLKHQVGVETDDAAAIKRKAWSSRRKEGFLFFGPFLMLPPGSYLAVFRMKVEAAVRGQGSGVRGQGSGPLRSRLFPAPHIDAPEVGYLDVYTGEGTELATRLPLNPSDWPAPHGYRFVEIPFRVTKPHPVQTRCFFAGGKSATVSLDFVLIKREKQGQNIRLEAEDFFSSVGRVIKDEKATEGICLGITPPSSGARRQPILEETFVFLTAGRYEVCCSARGEAGEVATLRVRRVAATSHYRRFDVFGSFSKRTLEQSSFTKGRKIGAQQPSFERRSESASAAAGPTASQARSREESSFRKRSNSGSLSKRTLDDASLKNGAGRPPVVRENCRNLLLEKEAKGGAEADFSVSKGILNLATGGVHAVSLWPAGKGLKAVDYVSFTLVSGI